MFGLTYPALIATSTFDLPIILHSTKVSHNRRLKMNVATRMDKTLIEFVIVCL
jgi:hypothetical protein